MTPSQCKAARAFLGMTQHELAQLSGVQRPTIMRYETGRSHNGETGLRLYRRTIQSITKAFERKGITFSSTDKGGETISFNPPSQALHSAEQKEPEQ